MDGNPRSHMTMIVSEYKEQEAIDIIFWPSMSQDINPIDHVWNVNGRNLGQLRVAIVDEWNRFPQLKFRRHVQRIILRVMEQYWKRGRYN